MATARANGQQQNQILEADPDVDPEGAPMEHRGGVFFLRCAPIVGTMYSVIYRFQWDAPIAAGAVHGVLTVDQGSVGCWRGMHNRSTQRAIGR